MLVKTLLLFSSIFLRVDCVSPYDDLPASQQGENHYFLKWWERHPVDENMNIFIPKNGLQPTYPIVLFLGGFASNMITKFYDEFLSQTSYKHHGAVVVSWDAMWTSPTDNEKGVKGALKIINFSKTDLQGWINKNFRNPVKLDPTRIFIMSHSSGSRIATVVARRIGVSGIIYFDPVDGDPYKYNTPIINSTTLEPEIPIIVLETERGKHEGLKLGDIQFPPCCPEGISSSHYYEAYKGPKHLISVKYYGHADILNDYAANPNSKYPFCASVEDIEAHPFSNFRNFASGVISAFLAKYSSNDCVSQKYLVDESTFTIEATALNENVKSCGRSNYILFQ